MIPSIILALGFSIKKYSVLSGILCGILGTILDYVFTKNISSCFLGTTANLVGLILMELFLRMKNKNTDALTEKAK